MMKKTFRQVVAALGLAVLVATPNAEAQVPNLGGSQDPTVWTAAGGTVTVTFLYSWAGNVNHLYAWVNGVMTPRLFTVPPGENEFLGASAADPLNTATFEAAAGASIMFLLCTSNGPANNECAGVDDFTTGWWSGPGTGNSDGTVHVATESAAFWNSHVGRPGQDAPEGSRVLGFEDRDALHPLYDADFNDTVWALQGLNVVPEPATMGLLALGLVGLAGAGAARRRRNTDRS